MVSKYVKLKNNGKVILHNTENKNLMIAGQPVEYEVIPDEQVLQDLLVFSGLN